MIKSLVAIGVLSGALVGGACGKKQQDAGGGSGSASPVPAPTAAAPAPAPAAAPSPGPAPTPAPSTMSAPPAAGAIATLADYRGKASELNAKEAELAKESDCKKLGAAFSKFADDDRATIDAVGAYEKAHPDDKKAFEAETTADMQQKLANVGKCTDDPAVKAALAKFPPE